MNLKAMKTSPNNIFKAEQMRRPYASWCKDLLHGSTYQNSVMLTDGQLYTLKG